METITILVPAVVENRYNDDTLDWTDTTDTDVDGCIVYPRTSDEDNDNRSALISGLTVLLPPNAPTVPHTARIQARGAVWEVAGDDADWQSPWGWEPGREVNLRRVDG